ncbi:helix-turn-helix domain-containing protein [Streptomyces sp. NBC_01306]|uniref:helix-turn-helix domain-containing protein n=1 Tax=Streptomyces sp. NBC_01306 TaxID=2903819 RepID=UPI0022514D1A|nr:helix-turn-helix transcriptional regulator [Streptomyces sp. NBC_01306]MCX4728397.1 helix-turn-helix domain-containing protein [Streptomyces sp. NBC_01306]
MNETFGQALRRFRGTRSVRDVAQLANCGKSYVSDLENNKRPPTIEVATALDHALGAQGRLVMLAQVRPGSDPLEQADALQRGLKEDFAAGPMSDASLDEVEYTVAWYGRATRHRSETELLTELLEDFADLRLLLAGRQSGPVRKRLTIVAAQMSSLMALTLLKLGDDRARAWWRTGRAAAAAADDRATLSWMYAQEAYQHYYCGDIEGAVELACRAQYLAGGLPCVGPALAAPLEARALARLSKPEAAADALSRAEVALKRLPVADQIDSAFGYSESQLRFHSGNALTHLGSTSRARTEQDRALELYPASDHMDRTLIHLDQAMCLAIDGDVAGAALHATNTVVGLPLSHRSPLIIYRAQDVAVKVPEAREVSEVRVLREVLALRPGE